MVPAIANARAGKRDVRGLVMFNHQRAATAHLHQRLDSSARVADARDLERQRCEVGREQHRAGDVRAPAAVAIIEVGLQTPAIVVTAQGVGFAADGMAHVVEDERVIDGAASILSESGGRDCRKKRNEHGELEAHRAVSDRCCRGANPYAVSCQRPASAVRIPFQES